MYILNREVIDSIQLHKPVYLEKDVFPKLAKQGELSAFLFQGKWFDVTKDELFAQASDVWHA